MEDKWHYESLYWAQGHELVCGVDEAGAGPLAGDVCAAAVILPKNIQLSGLGDSKKVSEKTRERLFVEIKEQAIAWSVAWASAEEIDQINILNARMLAMERAISTLNPAPTFALVDGHWSKGITLDNLTIKKGDDLSASISAASILAKVSRDHYMIEMAAQYPQYQFEKHKGYPTALHYQLLRQHGPCPIHRKTFLKNL